MKSCIEGIFLRKIPYSDSSSIVHFFTAEHGVIPFLYRHKAKSNSNNLFFPLNIVNLTTNIKINRDIQHIDQITPNSLLISIRENIHKLNVAQFMAEFLYQLLHYPQTDRQLFNFLKHWVLSLENAPEKLTSIWHIYGLFKLLEFSGIEPVNNFSQQNQYFNLEQAAFTDVFCNNCLSKELSSLWAAFLNSNQNDIQVLHVNKEYKYKLIESLLKYFHVHTHQNINLKSLDVLQEMYSSF